MTPHRISRPSARASRQAKFLGTGKFARRETTEERRFRLARERQTTQPVKRQSTFTNNFFSEAKGFSDKKKGRSVFKNSPKAGFGK